MDKQQRKQTKDILRSLVKLDRYASLSAVTKLLMAEAATEKDEKLKARFLILAGKVQVMLSENDTAA